MKTRRHGMIFLWLIGIITFLVVLWLGLGGSASAHSQAVQPSLKSSDGSSRVLTDYPAGERRNGIDGGTATATDTTQPTVTPTSTGFGTCIPIPGPDGQMPHVPCYATYTATATPTRSPTVTASTTSQLGCYISVISATTSCTTQGVYTYQFTLYHNCGSIPSATAYFEVASNPDGPWTELAQQSVPPNYPTVGGTFNISSIPNQYNWYRVRIYGSAPIPHPSYWGESMPATICGRPLPCAGGWTGRAEYPEQVDMQAAVVDNGLLYSFGGRDTSGAALSSGYRYDAATNAWTALAQMPVPRFGASAIGAGGGVYLMNGSDGTGASNQQYIYYSQSNHWQVLGTGLAATYGQTMLKLNEEFIRIGGIDSAGAYTSSVELYGRGLLAPLPEARAYMAATAIDGYIYAAGGSGPSGPSTKTYRYNRGTNTWDDTAVADLPWPVSGASATYLNGQWILAGGSADNPEAVLAWDRLSNAWTTLPPMSSGHAYAASGVLNNALYLAGGLAGSNPTNATERYVQGPCATPTAPPTVTGTRSPSATATRTTTGTTTGTTTRTPTGSPTTINATISPTIAITSTPTSCALTFSDVPPENTFYSFVRCLACRGIVNGYPDGTFKPDSWVTRGQLAKIVSQSAGFTEPANGQTFEDVAPGSTFYEYIERLATRKVMGGYQCGVDPVEPCVEPENRTYFRPNVGATRGQLTKIVSNAEVWVDPVPPTFYTFADVEPGSTFWLFVERLKFNRPGAMNGYACGGPGEPCDSENRPYFRPNNPLTRGQTSKIVANTFFPDCQTQGR
jgi:N-acetylneuraminic acid mutarotase